ncbi:MAG: HEPN domain-containing protein [bacterium]
MKKEMVTEEYWLKSAEMDWETVEHLFRSKDYHWALFIAHLVLEKVLKAYYVKHKRKEHPYGHNLVIIAEKSDLELTEEQLELLEIVNRFNIAVRYPDEKLSFYKKCTKEYTEKHIKKIKEFYEWIRKNM